jgi:hypothetical protein
MGVGVVQFSLIIQFVAGMEMIVLVIRKLSSGSCRAIVVCGV